MGAAGQVVALTPHLTVFSVHFPSEELPAPGVPNRTGVPCPEYSCPDGLCISFQLVRVGGGSAGDRAIVPPNKKGALTHSFPRCAMGSLPVKCQERPRSPWRGQDGQPQSCQPNPDCAGEASSLALPEEFPLARHPPLLWPLTLGSFSVNCGWSSWSPWAECLGPWLGPQAGLKDG